MFSCVVRQLHVWFDNSLSMLPQIHGSCTCVLVYHTFFMSLDVSKNRIFSRFFVTTLDRLVLSLLIISNSFNFKYFGVSLHKIYQCKTTSGQYYDKTTSTIHSYLHFYTIKLTVCNGFIFETGLNTILSIQYSLDRTVSVLQRWVARFTWNVNRW